MTAHTVFDVDRDIVLKEVKKTLDDLQKMSAHLLLQREALHCNYKDVIEQCYHMDKFWLVPSDSL